MLKLNIFVGLPVKRFVTMFPLTKAPIWVLKAINKQGKLNRVPEQNNTGLLLIVKASSRILLYSIIAALEASVRHPVLDTNVKSC